MSKVLSVWQITGLSIYVNWIKSMETFTFFIGIDISKATLDWALVVANKLLFHYQSSNDKKGIESFIKHLKQQCPQVSFVNSLYCMEHTGIVRHEVARFEYGWWSIRLVLEPISNP